MAAGSGHMIKGAMVGLLPILALGVLSLIFSKYPIRNALALFFGVQFFAILYLGISADQIFVAICAMVFVLVLGETLAGKIAWPRYSLSSLALVLVGVILTQLSGWFGWRHVGMDFALADVMCLGYASIAAVVCYLLMMEFIEVRHVMMAMVIGGVLLVFTLYFTSFMGGAFFLRERFGLYAGLNPNLIAMQLDVLVPLAIAFSLSEKGLHKVIAWHGVLIFLVMTLLMTQSRGSVPGILLYGMYYLWKIRRNRGVLWAASLFCLIGISYFGPILMERLLSKKTADMGSNYERYFLLKTAWKVLGLNNYVFGTGMDAFRWIKSPFGFPLSFDLGKNKSSHNFYLEIWLGWGSMALLGWFNICAGSVISLFKSRGGDRIYFQTIALAIVGYSIHGFVDSALMLTPLMLQISALLGCGVYVAMQNSKSSFRSNISESIAN
jgi:hypothetical protein